MAAKRKPRKKAPPVVQPVATPAPRKELKISSGALEAITRGLMGRQLLGASALPPPPDVQFATMPKVPRQVVPRTKAGNERIAMDAEFGQSWYGPNAYGFGNGQGWLGYPYLAELTQRPEFRRPSEITAREMTRKWIILNSTGKTDKSEKIKKLEQAMKRYKVQDVFRRAAEQDGYFGRSQIYIDLGDDTNERELATPLMVDPLKIKKGGLKALRVIEPMWSYPAYYNSSDPLHPDYFKPESWFVMARQVHRTRLLTLVSREMPDLLKPAYAFGGLSLSQMLLPYVDNWLRTRQAVSNLIHSFSVMVLKTNLAATLEGINNGAEVVKRIALFNNFRDNSGTFVLDNETEDFANVSAQLANLDKLQAQSQEQMASVAGIPLVKLLGITPSGLNACLPGDILILTNRGQVPIRDVTTADMVMTREGMAPLTFAGITKHVTELFEIKTASATLRCTGNHPIWITSTNEFVAAENVRVGQSLLLTGGKNVTQKTRRPWHGAVSGSGNARTATTLHGTLSQSGLFSFIGQFGKYIAAQSQMGFKSIILTTTKRIISRRILNRCAQTFMLPITTLIAESTYAVQPVLSPYFAPNAGASSFRAVVLTNCTARSHAKIEQGNGGTGRVVSVRKIQVESQPVYDLTVSRGYLPEFFANGILTHNSTDGEIRAFYDWIHSTQETLFTEPLSTVIEIIQLSEFGEIDPEIGFKFVPLWQLDEAGQAAVRKTNSDIDLQYLGGAVLSPLDVRKRIAAEPDSLYTGIDVDDLPEVPDPMGASEISDPDSAKIDKEAEGEGGATSGV